MRATISSTITESTPNCSTKLSVSLNSSVSMTSAMSCFNSWRKICSLMRHFSLCILLYYPEAALQQWQYVRCGLPEAFFIGNCIDRWGYFLVFQVHGESGMHQIRCFSSL